MGRIVRLVEVIDRLSDYDGDFTIYASKPWTEMSHAIVVLEPETGGLPVEAAEAGMKYFLEISIARNFVEDWISSLNETPSSSAICQRLIQYAINDA